MSLLSAALQLAAAASATAATAPALPPVVPTKANGPAPAGAAPVVRAWADAVRRADFDRAAELFADDARVQNGGPVERLDTRSRKLVWNASLPCGARVAKLAGANGYAIVTFRLVERRGGSCGSGIGAPARVAMKIADGRITGWYRLPAPGAAQAPPSGPLV